MPPKFYSKPSLHIEIYDTMTSAHWESTSTDIKFLRQSFRDVGGPILELACGTGRVAVPLAETGYEIHGLDASLGMLAVATAKKGNMASEASKRLALVQGDMREFKFPIQFGGIYSTYRSFQNLLTPEDQECCLRCIYRHLRSDGLLVLNLFDPRYELLLSGECPTVAPSRSLVHPTSGNRVTVEVLQRENDVLHQCLSEIWRFTEFGPDDRKKNCSGCAGPFARRCAISYAFADFGWLHSIRISNCHLRTTVKNRFGLPQNRFELITDRDAAPRT